MNIETRMYALADQWRESGLKKKTFCELHELGFHQFSYYERKQRRTKSKITAKEVNFFSLNEIPATKSLDNPTTKIQTKKIFCIELPNGVKIEFY